MQNMIQWRTESRTLGQLTPLEKNPFGKFDARKAKRLEEKILRLGVFDVATVDTDGVLLTFNKRHHVLTQLFGGTYAIEVKVPDRVLTEAERKEIIVTSNIHEGEWIREILEEEFKDIDLSAIGLELAEIDKLLEDKSEEDGIDNEAPVYPIVAKFSEKHDAFIIICNNEIDSNFIREVLGFERMQSYKNSVVGKSQVITAKDFIQKWNAKSNL